MMLRLPATKIELGSRDLVWHIDRYQQRKHRYEADYRAQDQLLHTRTGIRHLSGNDGQSKLQQQRLSIWPTPGRDTADDALVSSKPVPLNSRAFWDGIMTIAGTSSKNTDPLPHEFEDSFSEVLSHSVASYYNPSASGSNVSLQIHAQGWGGSHKSEEQGQQQGLSKDRYHLTNEIYDSSLERRTSTEVENTEESADQSISEESPRRKMKHRHKFFGFRFAGHDGGVDEDILNNFSSQLDLDGLTDGTVDHGQQRQASASSRSTAGTYKAVHAQRGLHVGDALDGSTEIVAQSSKSSLHSIERKEHSTAPAVLVDRSVEYLRSHSGDLPRSPLYISQAVPSSSPVKSVDRSGTPSDYTSIGSSAQVSQSPRHSRNYRPRSDSPESKVSRRSKSNSTNYESPGVSLRRRPGSSDHLIFLSGHNAERSSREEIDNYADTNDDYDGISSSPHKSSSSPNCSIKSTPPRETAYNLSPAMRSAVQHARTYANLFQHPTALGHGSPLLPPPFSANRRLVSFNTALPNPQQQNPFASPIHPSSSHSYQGTSSPDPLDSSIRSIIHIPQHHHTHSAPAIQSTIYIPANQPTYPSPSAQHPPPPTLPARYSPTPSPRQPTTPHRSMRVYNDALPATSQPQTPIGLPRHGLNTMTYHDRGAYTAPAGTQATPRRRFRDSSAESTTGRRREGLSVMEMAWRDMRDRQRELEVRVSWRGREREEQENLGEFGEGAGQLGGRGGARGRAGARFGGEAGGREREVERWGLERTPQRGEGRG